MQCKGLPEGTLKKLLKLWHIEIVDLLIFTQAGSVKIAIDSMVIYFVDLPIDSMVDLSICKRLPEGISWRYRGAGEIRIASFYLW